MNELRNEVKDVLTVDVSVLVTVYNQNLELSLLMKLLSEQDFSGSWELLVCDDGSSENTLDVLQKAPLPATAAVVRHYWQQHRGARRAHSRNNGLRSAVGNLIIMLDADMAVPRNFVTQHVAMHSEPYTLVYGSRYRLFTDDVGPGFSLEEAVRRALKYPRTLRNGCSIPFQSKYANSDLNWLGCMSCNMSIFSPGNRAPLMDERFYGWGAEDQELACRLLHYNGYTLKYAPDLYGVHIERQKHSDLKRVPISSDGEIRQYLGNLIYFKRLYPNVDTKPLLRGLAYFDHDHGVKQWVARDVPDYSDEHLRKIESLLSEVAKPFPY